MAADSEFLLGLGEVFGEVFGSFFPTGILRKITLNDNGKGGYTSTHNDYPDVSILVETATDVMRGERDYNDKDVALIILRRGLADVDLTVDDKAFVNNVWYNVKVPITADPAKAAWIARGSPTNG